MLTRATVRHNDTIGPANLVGCGGTQANILQDVRLLALQLRPAAIIAELRELKSGVHGWRGSPTLDLDAVAAIIAAVVGALVAATNTREIDLNPVVVSLRETARSRSTR